MNLTHHPEPGDHLLLDYLGREALPRAAHEWQQEDVSDGCQLPVQKLPVFSFSPHRKAIVSPRLELLHIHHLINTSFLHIHSLSNQSLLDKY